MSDLNATMGTSSVRQTVAEALFEVTEEFDVLEASTPLLIRKALQLRHQVYCVERGFLDADGVLEMDEFDKRSRHVVLVGRRTGNVVGTVRMVTGSERNRQGSFPMQRACAPDLLHHIPMNSTVEISRFAISKERRGGVSASLLRLGLVQGLVRLSREYGVTHWCAIMEPALLRLLSRSAIHFHPMGPLVEHHGLRQPCYNRVRDILATIAVEQPTLWRYLTEADDVDESAPQSRPAITPFCPNQTKQGWSSARPAVRALPRREVRSASRR